MDARLLVEPVPNGLNWLGVALAITLPVATALRYWAMRPNIVFETQGGLDVNPGLKVRIRNKARRAGPLGIWAFIAGQHVDARDISVQLEVWRKGESSSLPVPGNGRVRLRMPRHEGDVTVLGATADARGGVLVELVNQNFTSQTEREAGMRFNQTYLLNSQREPLLINTDYRLVLTAKYLGGKATLKKSFRVGTVDQPTSWL